MSLAVAEVMAHSLLARPGGRYLIPPDANSTAGASHVMEVVDVFLAVFDKRGNVLYRRP